jgi:hypothetical protein
MGPSCPTACTSRSTAPPNGAAALGSPRPKYKIHQMEIRSVENRPYQADRSDGCLHPRSRYIPHCSRGVKEVKDSKYTKWRYGASEIAGIKQIVVMEVCL